MNYWSSVFVVAKWEFARYFKLKGELISLVLWIGISAALWGGQHLITRFQGDETVRLLVLDAVQMNLPSSSRLQLELSDQPLEQALVLAESRELDGVLNISSWTHATLYGDSRPALDAVSPLLNTASFEWRLRHSGLSQEDFVALNTPMTINLEDPDDEPKRSAFEKSLAVVVLALVLVGVFSGFSYFFVSITSEKQQRVSEQIISTISAQAWTDGKILGLTCLSLKSVVTAAIWGTLGYFVYQRFGSNSGLSALQGGVDPGLLTLLIVFALLGIALWSSFYAMVAATISDPNSSSRSAIMLIPIIPVVLGFAALDNTDSPIVLALSWFPLTSFVFMPARLVTATVPAWDWGLSMLFLLFGIMLLRIAAGRVLAVAMLMFGQEPGWRDVWRWARARENAASP